MFPFMLQLYFGFMLTVAGLSKIMSPAQFNASLRTLGIQSNVILRLAKLLLPIYEITLGMLLILGWVPTTIALLNVITFTIFLGAKIHLATRKVDDCGCFGQQKKASIDFASLTTSFIFILLSILNLVLASNISVSPIIRIIAFMFYSAYVVLCFGNIIKRRYQLTSSFQSKI